MQSDDKHVYEVSFVFKKGEQPKVTHTLAKDESEAADNITIKYGAAHIVEVLKM